MIKFPKKTFMYKFLRLYYNLSKTLNGQLFNITSINFYRKITWKNESESKFDIIIYFGGNFLMGLNFIEQTAVKILDDNIQIN